MTSALHQPKLIIILNCYVESPTALCSQFDLRKLSLKKMVGSLRMTMSKYSPEQSFERHI